MNSKLWMSIAALVLFAALVLPLSTAAQTCAVNNTHHHYQVVQMPTSGGAGTSFFDNANNIAVVNGRGTVSGGCAGNFIVRSQWINVLVDCGRQCMSCVPLAEWFLHRPRVASRNQQQRCGLDQFEWHRGWAFRERADRSVHLWPAGDQCGDVARWRDHESWDITGRRISERSRFGKQPRRGSWDRQQSGGGLQFSAELQRKPVVGRRLWVPTAGVCVGSEERHAGPGDARVLEPMQRHSRSTSADR